MPTNTQQGFTGAAAQQAGGGQAMPAQAAPNVVPPTPPTGLEQQLSSLNQQYSQVRAAPGIGFDPATQQLQQAQAGGNTELQTPQTGASTNLNNLARQLAQNYGLPLGRGSIVDEQGNFLVTPDQLAAASGGSETLGTASAKLNYIAQALENQQRKGAHQRGVSALQTGLGLVQSRGRGSLAAMQSGMYQNLAQLYASEQYDLADFSYFIQKEQLDIQQDLMRRQEKLAKKQARAGVFQGIGLGIVGLATGNVGLAAGGFSGAVGNAAGTGWF